MVTLGAARETETETDSVYDPAERAITRGDVEGWISAVSARVDLRLALRSKITDAARTSTLRAAAHDAVVNGAASYLVAAATPTRASVNDAGAYDAVLWARYESALEGAAAALESWLDGGVSDDPSGISARMSGNFPPPLFPDAMRF